MKSSAGVGGINKLGSSLEPTNSDSCTVHKNEHESATLSRDRLAVLEQSILVKGSNKYVILPILHYYDFNSGWAVASLIIYG